MSEFKNPQQDPGLERRLLLVFALTFLIILAVQPILKRFAPAAPEEPKPVQQQAATPTPPAPLSPPSALKSSRSIASTPVPTKQATAESEVVIENDLYRITFTNRGAQVKSWVLKRFDDDLGRPLELVNSPAASKYGFPLSFWTYDETLRNKLNSAMYVPSGTGTQRAPAQITFEYSDGDTTVRKSFGFDHSYVVRAETSVTHNGNLQSAFLAWPAGFGDQTTPSAYAAGRIVSYSGGTNWHGGQAVQQIPIKKVSSGATINGPLLWAGAEDQYFAAVFLPDQPETAALVTLRNVIELPKNPEKPNPQEVVREEVIGTAVGDLKGPTTERVFVGPKELDVVESVHAAAMGGQQAPSDLRGLVNFGTFGIIARPLFIWLRWTYKYVGNWGWAIIIQTVIITLVLLPLRISGMKSSLKMQKAAPQIKAIQEKYKKYSMRDPRRAQMNQEVAALYKKEGVNPVGGCLPLVLQMPFLIAYYAMLGAAIELRHAHWLWVRDLSSPDPWHILPILVILGTLLVQRMTPAAGMDPAQQKMMNLMMPLMLGVISWNLAAGLCLYWAFSNLIAIVQQVVMNRTELGREMRAELEKRARKSKGK